MKLAIFLFAAVACVLAEPEPGYLSSGISYQQQPIITKQIVPIITKQVVPIVTKQIVPVVQYQQVYSSLGRSSSGGYGGSIGGYSGGYGHQ